MAITFNVVLGNIKSDKFLNLFIRNINFFLPYLPIFVLAIVMFLNPLERQMAANIYENIEDKTYIWKHVIESKSISFKGTMKQDLQPIASYAKFVFLFIFSFLPLILLFNFLKKKKYLTIKNQYFLIIILAPTILLLFQRDWGRWINLMSFVIVLFYLQNPVKKYFKNEILLSSKKIISMAIILFMIFHLSIVRIPHCCADKKIFGGITNNISILVYKILVDKRFSLEDKLIKIQ